MPTQNETRDELDARLRQIHAIRDIVNLVADRRIIDELDAGTLGELMALQGRAARDCDDLAAALHHPTAAPSPVKISVAATA